MNESDTESNHDKTQLSGQGDMIHGKHKFHVEDDSNFMLLSQLKLDSVRRKRVDFKGTFSFGMGDHNACMGVNFGDESLPVDVVTNCDLHASTTSDKCCACRCILEMDHAIRNQKMKWWPFDHACLRPPARQSEVQNHPTPLFLDVPRSSVDLRSLSSDENLNSKLQAAQKCKHELSGPRFLFIWRDKLICQKISKTRKGGRAPGVLI